MNVNSNTNRLLALAHSLRHWITKNSLLIRVFLSALLAISTGVLVLSWYLVTPIVLLVLLVVVAWIEEKDKASSQELQRELENTKNELGNKLKERDQKMQGLENKIGSLFDSYLDELAKNLGFGEQKENTERLSLYIHDNNNTFTLFRRRSSNPKYRGKRRSSYPDNQGCIAEGWQHGWYFDPCFPDPVNHLGEYIEYCSTKYGMDQETCEKIRMKSRVFGVLRIENKKDSDFFGVLVLESTQSDRFEESEAKAIMKSNQAVLADAIERLMDFIPKSTDASQRRL